MIIYHNPSCSKSRCALAYLKDKNTPFEVRTYLTEPFSKKEFLALLSKLNVPVLDIVRKSESAFKSLLKGKDLSEDEIIDILLENPKLIERPIVEWGANAVVARPLENLIAELEK